MASALSLSGKNLLLDSSSSWPPAYASIHNVDSPTDATSEATGGSPAYARKAITWAAASGGSIALNGTLPTFDVPASFTVKSVGLWTAASGGTFIGSFDVTDEAFSSQGTYTVTSGSITL